MPQEGTRGEGSQSALCRSCPLSKPQFPHLTDVPKEDADRYILPNETQYLLISNLRRHAISLQTLLKAVEYYQGLAG